MNLTQQQLAGLAKVSTPTVSRFEQAEKNVQLSSVLAILDVLGLTETTKLAFPDPDYRYDSAEGVTFWGQDGNVRVRVKISREALDDHFSERGPDPSRLSKNIAVRSKRSRGGSTGRASASPMAASSYVHWSWCSPAAHRDASPTFSAERTNQNVR